MIAPIVLGLVYVALATWFGLLVWAILRRIAASFRGLRR